MLKRDIISLYREILKHAQVFPSKNRLRIMNEIKLEFRRNKSMTNQNEIDIELSKATKGLSQLSQYTNLKTQTSGNWVIDLEKEPMPRRPK